MERRSRLKLGWMPEPVLANHQLNGNVKITHVVTLLDGSDYAAQALPLAQFICETTGAQLTLLSASREYQSEGEEQVEIETYLIIGC